MAGMRRLMPKAQQLKDSYGDDKMKLQKATMELYKNTIKYMNIQLRNLKVSVMNNLKRVLTLKNAIRYGIGTLTRPILAGMKVRN